MKKIPIYFCCALFICAFAGCGTIEKITQPQTAQDQAGETSPLPPYSGLKARIAVADFDIKAANATGEIGAGLREMLITALANSKRFTIVERQVSDKAIKEQEQTPDLIVTATVAEFEPQSSGGASGIGGGGGAGSGVLGGLLSEALNKAYMALDIRIVDAATSKVVAAARVQGQASDAAGSFLGEFFGGWSLGRGLDIYANTPMAKALRLCIIEGVRFIAREVPQGYYKY